jgi:hypothetical protein
VSLALVVIGNTSHADALSSLDAPNDRIVSGPTLIREGWQSLLRAGFDSVDTMLLVPGRSDQAWVFSGDQYARIDITSGTFVILIILEKINNHVSSCPAADNVISGPSLINPNWHSLSKAGFY